MKQSLKMKIFLVLLTALILPALPGMRQAVAEEGKLRVGVVGLAYEGGKRANDMAAEIQKTIVETLAGDERVKAVEINPAGLSKYKRDLLEDASVLPSSVSRKADLLIVAGVNIENDALKVTLVFIDTASESIIATENLGEMEDTSIFIDIGGIVSGQVQRYISGGEETAPAAPSGKVVHSHGVGIVVIKNGNIPMAQRGSLALAERDAAERALGAYVELAAVPENQRKRIVSSLQAQLMNVKVLSHGPRGDVYVTEIEADVVISADVTDGLPPPAPVLRTGMDPAVQVFAKGAVNWETGIITARGFGIISGNDAQSMEKAKRAAKMDAYANALEIIASIILDADSTVAGPMNGNPQMAYKIQGLVQGAEVVESKQIDNNTWQITIQVPMRGIKGINVVFSDIFSREPTPTPAPVPVVPDTPTPAPEQDYTGLVIDARGTGLLPALCPQIVDEDGNVIYGAGGLPPSYMIQQGAAAYVKGEAGPAQGDMRQGNNPLRIKAVSANGPQKVRIVVSNQDAYKIRLTNSKTRYLDEARVVIIID